jgi:mRNA interferase HicA
MKYLDAARKLRRLGCVEIPRKGDGSHRKWHNPATNAYTTLPDWGGRDLKIGTLRGAVKQLGLDWTDFLNA